MLEATISHLHSKWHKVVQSKRPALALWTVTVAFHVHRLDTEPDQRTEDPGDDGAKERSANFVTPT